jgi:hypothetical protein
MSIYGGAAGSWSLRLMQRDGKTDDHVAGRENPDLEDRAAGEVLGLSAVLSSVPYEVTTVATSPCRVSFIHREPFLSSLASTDKPV